MATLQENIDQAINDFNNIKQAIIEKGVEVPAGTPTRDYGEKILNIETGVDVSADTVVAAALRAGFTAHEASGAAIAGTIQNYEGAIISGATPGAQAKYEEGVEAGKKSEYDAFWDNYQNHGNYDDTNFSTERLFAFKRWNDENFFPKYDIKIYAGDKYNAYFLFASSSITNLTQRLKDCGVTLDTSKAKKGNEMFAWCSSLTHVPTVSYIGYEVAEVTYTFAGCPKLVEVEKFVLPADGRLKVSKAFDGTVALQSLTIEGTIGHDGFNTSWSPLSKASLTSVINALSDTTTGLTVTVRLSAVKKAFETSEGVNDGDTSDEWLQLIATKPNWTINTIDS